MRKLDIPESCARKLSYWLRQMKEDEQWHYDQEHRRGCHDAEAQYAGRLKLISRILFQLEDLIPQKKED